MTSKPKTLPRLHRIELYRDHKGEFRWRLRAPNRRVIADCGEGYTSRHGLRKAVTRFLAGTQATATVELPSFSEKR